MLFLDFASIISSEEGVLEYLREKGVLRKAVNCGKCNRRMNEQAYGDSLDGRVFRCGSCKTRRSVRTDSFLEGKRLLLREIAVIVYLLSMNVLNKTIAEVTGLEEHTIGEYAAEIRRRYACSLNGETVMLGGQGVIVQVDESLLAKAKRTRNRHARPIDEQWIFGMYDTERRVGVLRFIPNKEETTLLPIILTYCRPGTVIVSDGHASYQNVPALGFEHRVVVHEHHFVDPSTGVHTNCIEAYWQRAKRKFKWIYGTSRRFLASHLAEFMWEERFGKTFSDRWRNTLLCLSD